MEPRAPSHRPREEGSPTSATPTPGPTRDRRIDLDQHVEGPNGPIGKVVDFVVDPIERILTHLVVGPARHHELANLVPMEAIRQSDTGTLSTVLTPSEFAALPIVGRRARLRLGEWPHLEGEWTVGITETLPPPYYDIGSGPGTTLTAGDGVVVGFDRIPAGDVEIRRESEVFDRDDRVVGHVESVVVDHDGIITHLVIDRGRLWHHREAAVAVAHTRRMTNDAVKLDLTADEVAALPWVQYRGRNDLDVG